MREARKVPANNYIVAIERAWRVLEAFQGQSDVSLRDLTRRAGMVKSSVYRILFTLERLGYVERGTSGYSVSPKLTLLAGDGGRPLRGLGDMALPFMREVLRRFQETVNLGVLEEGEVVYLRVLESPHPFRLAAHAGMRSPVYSSALGKSLLAHRTRAEVEEVLRLKPPRALTPRTVRNKFDFFRELDRVRLRGYAVDNEEDARGARCVGVPVMGADGKVAAALSISGPSSRVAASRDREFAEALRQAARQIETLLGYAPRPAAASGGGGR
ncbi:MAG TPA: IclR family transcriptional regulator [Terriglobales bacterium]|nr:IclR family transcriptional regulator [Terriglobales bacterium]